jgi:hypothetical protein
MKTMDIYSSALTEEEKAEILGKEPTVLSYKLSDYDYKTTNKPRILSGLRRLDYMLKGFELGCITLWSGSTNSRKDYNANATCKRNSKARQQSILL